MSGILFFLAALAFAMYAKNKGRSVAWGALPFLLSAAMQFYAEVGGGPEEPVRTIYAFAITGFLYFVVGQAATASEREQADKDATGN